jgi:hypothetical protein
MKHGQSTRAAMPIPATRLRRFLAVVVLTTGGTALVNLLSFPD